MKPQTKNTMNKKTIKTDIDIIADIQRIFEMWNYSAVSHEFIATLGLNGTYPHCVFESDIINVANERLFEYFIKIGRLSFVSYIDRYDGKVYHKAILKTRQGWESAYNAIYRNDKFYAYDRQLLRSMISNFESDISEIPSCASNKEHESNE